MPTASRASFVGLGEKWGLIARTLDGGYFDGYSAFRLKDVGRVHRDTTFQSRFARTQPEWPPTPPPVDLDSTVGVLRSLATFAPLVGIEKANERDALWIGVPVKVGPKWTWLHEVRPDATWQHKPLGYKTRQITNVQVGDHYMTALAAMAGERPSPGSDHAPRNRPWDG